MSLGNQIFGVPGLLGGGGGDLSLPAGAMGAWYAKDVVTTPRVMIPNALATTQTTQNYLQFPRRLFNAVGNAVFYATASNCTVTNNNATAPDATNEATTVAWGSADARCWGRFTNMPAGTYTFSIAVKTTDAATVDFRIGWSSSLATKTATGDWTTFSTTFTTAGGTVDIDFARSLNASTPANLAICDARLNAGSSDLGTEELQGHMYFGSSYSIATPTIADGVIPNGSNSRAICQFAESSNVSEFTALAVCRKKVADVDSALCARFPDWAVFTQYFNGSDNGTEVTGFTDVGTSGLWTPRLDEWEIIGCHYDGTTFSNIRNFHFALGVTDAGKTFSLQDLSVFYGSGFRFSQHDINSFVFWDRALSKSELETAYEYLKSVALESSISVDEDTDIFLVPEGDSITVGVVAGDSYARIYSENASPQVVGNISALSGSTMVNVNDRAAQVDNVLPIDKRGKKFYLSLLIGANDLGYTTGADHAATVGAYTAARKAAGWDKVVLCTVLPSSSATRNTNRNAFNAIITGTGWAEANGVDAICDFAADPTIGPDAAGSDTGLYPDGLHPSLTTQQAMEVIYRSVIDSLSD